MMMHLRIGTISSADIPPHWADYILAYHDGVETRIAEAKARAGEGGGGRTGSMASAERKREILEALAANKKGS